jgi:hypothetical protein
MSCRSNSRLAETRPNDPSLIEVRLADASDIGSKKNYCAQFFSVEQRA